MRTNLSITDICYQVGFNNLSNFNRQFLSLKGMSPSRWRAYQQLNAASATESTDAAKPWKRRLAGFHRRHAWT